MHAGVRLLLEAGVHVPGLRDGDRSPVALGADASGLRLDAVLCLMQAAWAATRPDWGMPERVDPINGWIVEAYAVAGE